MESYLFAQLLFLWQTKKALPLISFKEGEKVGRRERNIERGRGGQGKDGGGGEKETETET